MSSHIPGSALKVMTLRQLHDLVKDYDACRLRLQQFEGNVPPFSRTPTPPRARTPSPPRVRTPSPRARTPSPRARTPTKVRTPQPRYAFTPRTVGMHRPQYYVTPRRRKPVKARTPSPPKVKTPSPPRRGPSLFSFMVY